MAYRLAASLASPSTVRCVVNAGRWPARGPAATAGWYTAPVLAGLAKLADIDYLSAGTDWPAHARYEGVLADTLTTTQGMSFWTWEGEAANGTTTATLRVVDDLHTLDPLVLADVRGAPVRILQGQVDGAVADAEPLARFVLERVEVLDDNTKAVQLVTAHPGLDESITRAVFMPNLATYAWNSVPVVIGAVASVPALPVNSDGTVCWLADGPLAHVGTVMDRGDSLENGTYEMAPDNQQLLTVSPPVGPVVCDVSTIGTGMQPATLAQALGEIFRRVDEQAWSLADAEAIDAATGYAGVGYYADQPVTAREALAAILPSYGAWWWEDAAGLLRFTRITDPSSYVGDLAFDLIGEDLTADIIVSPDLAPNLTRRMAFRPNAKALGAGDLVTDMVDVPPARRAELTAAWRGQVYASGPLPPQYMHAEAAEPFLSVFWRREDAQAELDRVVALYAQARVFAVVRLTDKALRVQPGQVGKLTYGRYGMGAGRLMLVRSVTCNRATGETALVLWG
jgi:hypothetical protein